MKETRRIGPWQVDNFVARERAEWTPASQHWATAGKSVPASDLGKARGEAKLKMKTFSEPRSTVRLTKSSHINDQSSATPRLRRWAWNSDGIAALAGARG